MSTIAHNCMICKRAALVTCVSNGGGIGPGHTCVVIDGFVYTFERHLPGWRDLGKSGWLKIKNSDYLKLNTHRPVIIQELSTAVNASYIYEYISISDYNDDDYGSSGVCSQQAMKAISAGVKKPIFQIINIPRLVYLALRNSNYVSKTSYVFSDEGKGLAQNISGAHMWALYPGANKNKTSNPSILQW